MSGIRNAGRRGPITLLTDFGTRDGYAAAMHGVILGIAPAAVIHNAAHDIEPRDVVAAALCLERYWLHYPRGTIHVVVVDPGVGSERRALVIEAEGRLLVGPDNGVLTPALRAPARSVHVLENPALRRDTVSATFHGRDVFAPAAAHLVLGVAPSEFGAPYEDAVVLAWPAAVVRAGVWQGIVIAVDRFGNLVTNIPASELEAGARVVVAGRHETSLRRTYSDVEAGGLLALGGSDGRMEVAVSCGSAAHRLKVGVGAAVQVFAPAAG